MNFNPKISHEFPEQFLNAGGKVTDYDYALVHLYKNNTVYRMFFDEQRKAGREIILDNSLFELGEAYDGDLYFEEIRRLSPTYYVLPDVFNNFEKNIESIKDFLKSYPDLVSKPIAVIHGETFWELLKSYLEITNLLQKFPGSKIAIPFGSRAFEIADEMVFKSLKSYEKGKYQDEILYRKSQNRFYFLEMLSRAKCIKREFKHHLLGNYMPIEYSYYRNSLEDFSFIDSIDTSHPIALGIEEITYDKVGLYYKSPIKINDIYDKEFNSSTESIIFNNINEFRKICRGEN